MQLQNNLHFKKKLKIVLLSALFASLFISNITLTSADDIGMYYKLQTRISKYLSASRDDNTVVGIKFKIGYIQTFIGGAELIPPNQTFFAGGANSVRGWQARQLVPEITIEELLP